MIGTLVLRTKEQCSDTQVQEKEWANPSRRLLMRFTCCGMCSSTLLTKEDEVPRTDATVFFASGLFKDCTIEPLLESLPFAIACVLEKFSLRSEVHTLRRDFFVPSRGGFRVL